MAGQLTLSSKLAPFPYASAAIALYTSKAELLYDEAAKEPTLDLDGSKLTTEENIVQALAKAGGLSEDSEKVRSSDHAQRISAKLKVFKTKSFFALAKSIPSATAIAELTTLLNELNDHLAYRTFLVGHSITSADWIVWGSIKGQLPAHRPRLPVLIYMARKWKSHRIVEERQPSPSITMVQLP